METRIKLGGLAEWRASEILINKGHRILYKNYKTKFGEIDLVSQKGDTLYLVEVKARDRKHCFINPQNRWELIQKHRMVKSFNYYLNEKLSAKYSEIKIIFIWFAKVGENELKLICIDEDIEIDN
jgi:putative endonuclease